ncbi:MAG: CPBP family intramembrane metalloprotease, partial [Eubacteriales bacterium]|nr:CPBP family intramembrane metalloprotease [Eubacteriales bacterium]
MNSHKKASLIMLLLLIHLIFISKIIVMFIAVIFPSIAEPENSTFLQMIGSTVYFVIPLLIYMAVKKLPINKVLMLKPISLKNFFIIIFLSLVMQPLLQFINILTTTFNENELAPVLNMYLESSFWKLFLAVAVFPAVLEEVVFRGIFVKEYEDMPFWFGAIFSGIFFGIMHLTITQLFYAAVAGVIMAALVKVTGSIWAGILSHFVLNGTQITMAYFSKKIIPDEVYEESLNLVNQSTILEKIYLIAGSMMYLAFSLPFLATAIYLFVKVNREKIAIIKQE